MQKYKKHYKMKIVVDKNVKQQINTFRIHFKTDVFVLLGFSTLILRNQQNRFKHEKKC